MVEKLELTPEDRNSALWRKIEKLLARRLDSCRRQNDGINVDVPQTAALRGRIAELKHLRNLLAMETSPAQVVDGACPSSK